MLEKFIKGAIINPLLVEEVTKNLVSTNQSLNSSQIFLFDTFMTSCFGTRVRYYVLLSANADVTIMYH